MSRALVSEIAFVCIRFAFAYHYGVDPQAYADVCYISHYQLLSATETDSSGCCS